MKAKKKKLLSAKARLGRMLAIDLAVIGLALCVYALFHHVIPKQGTAVEYVRSEVDTDILADIEASLSTAIPVVEQTEEPTEAPEVTEEPVEAETAEPVALETPEAVETAAPTEEPTEGLVVSETAEPEDEVSYEPVDQYSDAISILRLQKKLSELGWLQTDYVDGTYNKNTRYAVAYVQKELQGLGYNVAATGYADQATIDALMSSDAPSFYGKLVTPEPTVDPEAEATAKPVGETAVFDASEAENGDFRALFATLGFAEGETFKTKTEYLSDSMYLKINHYDNGSIEFYVADIYIKNIDCLKTAFAHDVYGQGYRYYPWTIASSNNAILAISGDYYGARDKGIVIRNGKLYRENKFQDVCCLYHNGVMKTYSADEFNAREAMDNGAWQAWSFGPQLLDENGTALTEFESAVVQRNPRCGIGYFEQGHYCFVVVDGRSSDSKGVTLGEFAVLFEKLGCKAAYNLDGGNTACMVYNGSVVNEPSGGGRAVSDIIMLVEAQ